MKKLYISISIIIFIFNTLNAQDQSHSIELRNCGTLNQNYSYDDTYSKEHRSGGTGFVGGPELELVKIHYLFDITSKVEHLGSKVITRDILKINFSISTYNTSETVSWGISRSIKEPVKNYTNERFILDEKSLWFDFDLYYEDVKISSIPGIGKAQGTIGKQCTFKIDLAAYDKEYAKRFPILRKIIEDKSTGYYAIGKFSVRNAIFRGAKYANNEMMMSKYVDYLCETKRLNKCKDPKEEEKKEEAKKNKREDDDFWNGNDTKKNTTSQSNNNKNSDSFWDGNSSSADNQKSNTDKNDGDFDWDGATDADFKANYKAVQQNGLWGFVNDKGKLVINYQYESAQDFINNLAVVSIRDNDRKILYGVINGKNKYILKPIYTKINLKPNGTIEALKFNHFSEYYQNQKYYECIKERERIWEERKRQGLKGSLLYLPSNYEYIRDVYYDKLIYDNKGNINSNELIKVIENDYNRNGC